MALPTEEIKVNLTEFQSRWKVREGYEKGEAQTFLNEFFDCFSPSLKDEVQFEKHQSEGGFIDCLIPDVAIIEMKSAKEAGRLKNHRKQALDYWKASADPDTDTAAPPYVVLCAFRRFEIWEPGRFPKQPRLTLDLDDLASHFDAFAFLLRREPIFHANDEEVTVDAVEGIAKLLELLEARDEGSADARRSFVLQSVWCMFAEDTGQIDGLGFTRILKGLVESPERSSADDLGGLFERLNDSTTERPKHGMYAGVPYVNGSLFSQPTHLHLEREEVSLLLRLAGFDWSLVRPAVFGSLMQTVFGPERQHRLGAHYTPEAEIQLVVEPTILRPWRERINALNSFEDGVALLDELHTFRVLDPACGCGNFLSVAYREIRLVESLLRKRIAELAKAEGRGEWDEKSQGTFPLGNMLGIEIESFAVDLARLSLWMAQWLAGNELGFEEATLPLVDLDGIRRADALRVDWPECEAIVSNPPYHGSQNLRGVLTDDQIEFIEQEFGCGLKDLCVYWFRRAAQVMKPGDRAGMVGTNSISQNRAREASLNYVVGKGGVITDAVSRHKWPGEAVVNVSIVNWIQKPDPPPDEFVLDGEPVAGINTRLQESVVPIEEYEALAANKGRSFQGPIPVGPFDLDIEEGDRLLARAEADYSDVVKPYLVGEDIVSDPRQAATRFIIDFDFLPLEEAESYPEALRIVREVVKPLRDKNKDSRFRKFWWQFGRPRGEMREAVKDLERFIVVPRVAKRFLFAFVGHPICAGDAVVIFAFDDDYSMGILTSSIHRAWAMSEGSTLEDRPRYTPTSCFETFPWPTPSPKERELVAELVKDLLEQRGQICDERQVGLTTLYNQMDDGAWQELKKAHRKLDEAVARAYGWPTRVAHDPLEIKARLAERHAQILKDPDSYEPFTPSS
jgi:hypothetical protein